MALSLATGSAQDNNCANLVPLYPDLVTDYRWEKEEPGEAILRAVVGSVDQPNRIRYAVSSVPNLFTGQSVVSPASGQPTLGLSILTQVQEVWKIDDSADMLAPIYYPASCHFVIRVPNHSLVTSAVVAGLMRRTIGAPFRNGTDALDVALNPLLYGITKIS